MIDDMEIYVGELFKAVEAICEKQGAFTIWYDSQLGTWYLSRDLYPWQVYATPFYDGFDEGIPVQVMDDDGYVVDDRTVPFVRTGDVKADAVVYVGLMRKVLDELQAAIAPVKMAGIDVPADYLRKLYAAHPALTHDHLSTQLEKCIANALDEEPTKDTDGFVAEILERMFGVLVIAHPADQRAFAFADREGDRVHEPEMWALLVRAYREGWDRK